MFRRLARSGELWRCAPCCTLQRRSVSDAAMRYLEAVSEEACVLQEQMSHGEQDETIMRRYKAIERNFESALQYSEAARQLRDAQSVLGDPDLAEMAAEEVREVQKKMKEIQSDFDKKLVLVDDEDSMDVTMEVMGGAGGAEGGIFAGELFDCYKAYAKRSGWTWSEMDIEEESDDFLSIHGQERARAARISGVDVFKCLKWESGVHRVQRVPVTESGGRVHTSTAGVKVLPAFTELELPQYPRTDFHVTQCRNSGPGGQGVNSTDTACHIKHKPTGTVQYEGRTRNLQHNLELAWERLFARLWEMEKDKIAAERGSARESLAFSLDRHNKIRTYNWNRQTVQDHRLPNDKNTVQLSEFFGGTDLDLLIDNLIEMDTANRREGWLEERTEHLRKLKEQPRGFVEEGGKKQAEA